MSARIGLQVAIECPAARRGAPRLARALVVRALLACAFVSLGLGVLDGTVGSAYGLSGPGPIVTKVGPSVGPGTGGKSVNITGKNLAGATAVEFGGTPAASFTVSSSKRITAKSPAGAGTVYVTVTTRGGTSATGPADRYSYLPVVTGVSPNRGPAGGETTVTITGVDLSEASAVDFGSTAAASFRVDSATSITAVTPEHVAGEADVRVTTPQGTSARTPKYGQFTFVPTITSVSPSEGTAEGGTRVTVTGTGLREATILFGKMASQVLYCSSARECTVLTPAPGNLWAVSVRARANGLLSPETPADGFTYEELSIIGLSPDAGSTAGGTVVTVTGTGFALGEGTRFRFGRWGASSVDCTSTTECTVVAPESENEEEYAYGFRPSYTVNVSATVGRETTTAYKEFTYQYPRGLYLLERESERLVQPGSLAEVYYYTEWAPESWCEGYARGEITRWGLRAYDAVERHCSESDELIGPWAHDGSFDLEFGSFSGAARLEGQPNPWGPTPELGLRLVGLPCTYEAAEMTGALAVEEEGFPEDFNASLSEVFKLSPEEELNPQECPESLPVRAEVEVTARGENIVVKRVP